MRRAACSSFSRPITSNRPTRAAAAAVFLFTQQADYGFLYLRGRWLSGAGPRRVRGRAALAGEPARQAGRLSGGQPARRQAAPGTHYSRLGGVGPVRGATVTPDGVWCSRHTGQMSRKWWQNGLLTELKFVQGVIVICGTYGIKKELSLLNFTAQPQERRKQMDYVRTIFRKLFCNGF